MPRAKAVSPSLQQKAAEGDKPLTREYWSSRGAFYFATAGAAIGFGNVWRFPGLSFQYGGGAFFIPYFLAIVFIGIPLTVLEIGFGQYFQTGDIGVFGESYRVQISSRIVWHVNSSYQIFYHLHFSSYFDFCA